MMKLHVKCLCHSRAIKQLCAWYYQKIDANDLSKIDARDNFWPVASLHCRITCLVNTANFWPGILFFISCNARVCCSCLGVVVSSRCSKEEKVMVSWSKFTIQEDYYTCLTFRHLATYAMTIFSTSQKWDYLPVAAHSVLPLIISTSKFTQSTDWLQSLKPSWSNPVTISITTLVKTYSFSTP